jgi:hypothetical protein
MTSHYSAAGYYGFGIFTPGGTAPWIATLTRGDADAIVDVLVKEGWLGPVFEVREL